MEPSWRRPGWPGVGMRSLPHIITFFCPCIIYSVHGLDTYWASTNQKKHPVVSQNHTSKPHGVLAIAHQTHQPSPRSTAAPSHRLDLRIVREGLGLDPSILLQHLRCWRRWALFSLQSAGPALYHSCLRPEALAWRAWYRVGLPNKCRPSDSPGMSPRISALDAWNLREKNCHPSFKCSNPIGGFSFWYPLHFVNNGTQKLTLRVFQEFP